jgi:GTP cyclohydrolase I
LSKQRLVEIYARRLQVQERMTTQIASTDGARPLELRRAGSRAFAARMRGWKSRTPATTSAMLGIFRTNVKRVRVHDADQNGR